VPSLLFGVAITLEISEVGPSIFGSKDMSNAAHGASAHYDQKYFDWYKDLGKFGGWANLTKFAEFIKLEDTVLDFGCGGGYLLQQLECARKIGVEVNPVAAAEARNRIDQIYQNIEDVASDSVDVIVSNNALEHTLHPLKELESLFRILRPGGKIVMVVPCESVAYNYVPNDINFHLYSWSPMCIGNLMTHAGFRVESSKPYIHKWPPRYLLIARFGRAVFEGACRIYGRIDRKWYQVRAVAAKPL
jgi:SAM-dependent methyltransferase